MTSESVIICLDNNKITSPSRILYTNQKQESQWGPPISSTIAEIFLQHMESTLMKQLFDKKNIAFYTRYVDDVLIICSSQHITPETIHNYINRIHPNLHFNPTYANNNSINFLDLLIIRNQFPLPTDIYRKPTTTDTTINSLSNRPTEHKTAAYRYHINRMLSPPLTEERRQTEWEII